VNQLSCHLQVRLPIRSTSEWLIHWPSRFHVRSPCNGLQPERVRDGRDAERMEERGVRIEERTKRSEADRWSIQWRVSYPGTGLGTAATSRAMAYSVRVSEPFSGWFDCGRSLASESALREVAKKGCPLSFRSFLRRRSHVAAKNLCIVILRALEDLSLRSRR